MSGWKRMTENKTHDFPVEKLKGQFPIFKQKIYDKPLTFLDTAASAQKPDCVIDSISKCYSENYSNIHRGIYYLSSKLTTDYEDVREKISKFINAQSPCEIVFTKSATEALNLLANCLVKKFLKDEDEIIISYLEHHANIVPWQIQKLDKNIKLVVADLNIDSTLYHIDLKEKLNFNKKFDIIIISRTINHLWPEAYEITNPPNILEKKISNISLELSNVEYENTLKKYSAYALFTKEMYIKMRKRYPSRPSRLLKQRINQMWRGLNVFQRKRYIDIALKLQNKIKSETPLRKQV